MVFDSLLAWVGCVMWAMVNYVMNIVTGENEETKFSLFSLTGKQREYFTINIFPIFDTFYFKIFFFLVSTLIVFLTAITAAFIVINCFEYIHRCVKVSIDWLYTDDILFLFRLPSVAFSATGGVCCPPPTPLWSRWRVKACQPTHRLVRCNQRLSFDCLVYVL